MQARQGYAPTLYGGQWPAWRVAPDYQPSALTLWLENQADREHLRLRDLARLIAAQLPYKHERTAVYNTVYTWLRQGSVPRSDYAYALAVIFHATPEQLMHVIAETRGLRNASRPASRPMPTPPRPRRVPTYGTPEEILAQANAEVIEHLKHHPLYGKLLRAQVARLEAEARGQHAQRVVPGVPAEPVLAEDEALKREEARR